MSSGKQHKNMHETTKRLSKLATKEKIVTSQKRKPKSKDADEDDRKIIDNSTWNEIVTKELNQEPEEIEGGEKE